MLRVPRKKITKIISYETLPGTLQMALKEKPHCFSIRIGNALDRLVDTCLGSENFRLKKQCDLHKKLNLWRISAGTAGTREDDSHATQVKKLEESNFYRKEKIYRDGANWFPQYPHSPQNLTSQKSSNGLGGGVDAISPSPRNPQNDEKTL
jgi:hypothetical protein